LSPTLAPEDDEEYEDRRRNYKADKNGHCRHRGEDVIWHTRLQRQEYNLNQHARALDIREAHLLVPLINVFLESPLMSPRGG
jgi:hypothetical protein